MLGSARGSMRNRDFPAAWFDDPEAEDLADESVRDTWRQLRDRYGSSIKHRLRKLGLISRIVGLLTGTPTQPALPPPPPPIVRPDRTRKPPTSGFEEEQVLMESLGFLAAEAQSDLEADALVGALLPLAARQFPGAASILRRSNGRLQLGLRRATRMMRRDPRTRAWVKTLPTILSQTARSLERATQKGQRITPKSVRQELRRQAWGVLTDSTRHSF